MATAILSVLYPDEFTVYDYRVCEELAHIEDFTTLGNKRREVIWDGYERYCLAVRKTAPTPFSLRDKDRYLWGKSAAKQLVEDIRNEFPKAT